MEDPTHCKLFYNPAMLRGEDVRAFEEQINKFLAAHPNAYSFKIAQSMTVPPNGEADSVLLTLFYRELPAREG